MKPTIAIWNLGFRPFFLLGLIYSFILIVVWTCIQTGITNISFALPSVTWHAHEMLFGFVTAIVAGFILTASQNWSGVRGVHGKKLAYLVFLWMIARILSFLPSAYPLFIIADLAFYPLLSLALVPHLGNSSQKRNHIFFLFFTLMFIANLFIHSEYFYAELSTRSGYYLGLHTIIAIIVLIAGRVIPFFTEKAIPNAIVKRFLWIEKFSIVSVILFIFTQFFIPQNTFTMIVSFFAFAVHLIRWFGWRAYQALNKPILFILYLGYLWIPIGFLLYALSYFHIVPINIAAHAFGIGAIGILIYGMVNRVTLGHTGRVIHASKKAIIGYVLLNCAVLFRVLLAILMPKYTLLGIKIAGICWSLAFLILLIECAPLLIFPRPDGKEG